MKKEWIARHKADPDLDYDIIFKDDEDIHEAVKMEFSFLTSFHLDNRAKRASKEFRAIHAAIPNHEWEHRFDQLMELRLIEVPENFFDEKLFFNNPEDLKAIFAKLEEENLSFIHLQQEQAQMFEVLAQREASLRHTLENNFNEQDATRLDLRRKIDISRSILSSLRKKTTNQMHYEPVQAGVPSTKDNKK